MKTRKSAVAVAVLMLAAPAAWAQTPPVDAGRASRELEKDPGLVPQRATTPPLVIEAPAPMMAPASDLRFVIKSVKVTGNTVISTAELEALVADLATADSRVLHGASIGRPPAPNEHSFADLEEAAARITSLYRQYGYAVARAYIPAQELRDGVVTIAVLEGRLAKVETTNRSKLDDAKISGYLSGAQEGEVIRSQPIDRALLLLGDTPGVGAARASLRPGASVGTSDLVVQVDPGPRYQGSVEADNYGSPYTGSYRLGLNLNLNNSLGVGDLISLRGQTTDGRQLYGRASWQLPIGTSGLKAGLAVSATQYKLDEYLASLNSHGYAVISTAFTSYPLLRSPRGNIYGTVAVEDKILRDRIGATSTDTDKHIRLVSVGLSADMRDEAFGELLGPALSTWSASVTRGRLGIQSAAAQAIDDASARTSGEYTRVVMSATRLQSISDSDAIYVSVSGQYANKNLDSAEKFSLGGVYGVRAYAAGDGAGDQGWLTNVEWRHDFDSDLQGALFYDAGAININKNPFALGTGNSYRLNGWGLGLNTSFDGIILKGFVAWRTAGVIPATQPDRAPRLGLQLTMPF